MFAHSQQAMMPEAANHVPTSSQHVRRASAWLRSVACTGAVLIGLAAMSAPAAAQWRVGGFVGGEHESSWDEFLVIGADARGAVGTRNIELNPRVSYFIREGTTRFQLDFNVIKPLVLAKSSRIEPFVGTGVAFESVSYDAVGTTASVSQSNVGFNYIVGGTLKTAGRVQPFAQFVYSVMNDSPNNAVVSIGVHFKLGSAPAGK